MLRPQLVVAESIPRSCNDQILQRNTEDSDEAEVEWSECCLLQHPESGEPWALEEATDGIVVIRGLYQSAFRNPRLTIRMVKEVSDTGFLIHFRHDVFDDLKPCFGAVILASKMDKVPGRMTEDIAHEDDLAPTFRNILLVKADCVDL